VSKIRLLPRHLVCQHLENLSRAALEEQQEIIRDFVRNRHGLYALYRNDRLYYVGLASNLRSRLTAHLRDRHRDTWNRFSVYLTIGDDRLRELEALVVRIAQPGGNRQKGKLSKSQDLRTLFRRRMNECHKQKIASMMGDSPRRRALPGSKQRATGTGRVPALAKYSRQPFRLRWHFKGKLYRAAVRRDGTIRVHGKNYNSPSMAAYALRHRPTNGWLVWEFERAPGDWVKLDILRKR
jgi:hypothetical protein